MVFININCVHDWLNLLVNSIYQSDGLCHDNCKGSYAFFIVQGSNCWCSNFIPADQVSTDNCNSQCPGFDSDWCGNPDQGLYGYYQIEDGQPQGTSGGSSSSSPRKTSSVSTIPSSFGFFSPSTSLEPTRSIFSVSVVTVAPLQSTVQTSSFLVDFSTTDYSTVSSDSSSSTVVWLPFLFCWILHHLVQFHFPSLKKLPCRTVLIGYQSQATSAPSITSSPTQVYTSVTTVTGQVRTVLVTPTTASDSPQNQQTTASNHGLGTGTVVGIVLGVAVGLGLIVGLGVWIWLRRRHRNTMNSMTPDGSFSPPTAGSSSNNTIPSRQVSQLSSAGLLGKNPRILTTNLPSGNDLRSADTMSSAYDRRSMGTDQRLNPHAIWLNDDGRASNVSLQDNHDYSRQLRVSSIFLTVTDFD